MKISLLKALAYGFILWLAPFLAAMALYQVRSADRIFFETLMPIVITLVAMILAYFYFKTLKADFLKEGIIIGILWPIVSIILDLLMFTWGPMAMSTVDYMKDIGLTYLVYTIITIGIGYILEKKVTS